LNFDNTFFSFQNLRFWRHSSAALKGRQLPAVNLCENKTKPKNIKNTEVKKDNIFVKLDESDLNKITQLRKDLLQKAQELRGVTVSYHSTGRFLPSSIETAKKANEQVAIARW